ncbi:MAG: hypothetical protein R3B47_11820 [Bacteroidia bacterium]
MDEIGDLQAAIAAAAEASNMEDYRLQLLPKVKSSFEQIMEDLQSGAKADVPVVGKELRELARLQRMLQGNGVLAFMPYEMEIK